MVHTYPRAVLVAAVAGGLTAACGGPSLPQSIAVPTDPTPLTKCQIAASQSSPLVTEWPASEKARLEGMLSQGGVAVRYSGCEMTILNGCRLEGSYAFQRTTLSTDVLEIRSADELFAKLPLGAVSLEGELNRSGRLAIRTTVSGQMVFRGDPTRVAPGGMCEGATHTITAISIGAFKMLTGGAVGAGGAVGVAGAGTGGSISRSEDVLKQSGVPERCAESVEGTAHPDCSSPIQVFLTPLSAQPPPVATPQPLPQPLPQEQPLPQTQPLPPPQAQPLPQPLPQPGVQQPLPQNNAVYVRVPAVPEGSWILQANSGAELCRLPCSAWLARDTDYFLQREGGGALLDLPPLSGVSGTQAEVEFEPPRGSKALGIVGMSVGGAAVFAGLIVMFFGAIDDHSIDRNTGNIVEEEGFGPVPGLLVTTAGLGIATAGIIYTVYSRSGYKPVYRESPAASGPRVGIGAGGIVGAF